MSCCCTHSQDIREYYGVHTPDKRRTRTEIHEEFPEYLFEDGFAEEDVLWTLNYREVHEDVVERGRKALDVIFDNDEEQGVHRSYLYPPASEVDGHHSHIHHIARWIPRCPLEVCKAPRLDSPHRRQVSMLPIFVQMN